MAIKSLITTLLIVVSIFSGMGQDTGFSFKPATLTTTPTLSLPKFKDTLTAERFIEDSVGNGYEIQYRYTDNISAKYIITLGDKNSFHSHYISLVNIIAFKGNKQHTIVKDIKAIYSPVECFSDNRELWLKRLYQIQNKK